MNLVELKGREYPETGKRELESRTIGLGMLDCQNLTYKTQ